eukprot:757325-Hanusia_phi.AAC.3
MRDGQAIPHLHPLSSHRHSSWFLSPFSSPLPPRRVRFLPVFAVTSSLETQKKEKQARKKLPGSSNVLLPTFPLRLFAPSPPHFCHAWILYLQWRFFALRLARPILTILTLYSTFASGVLAFITKPGLPCRLSIKFSSESNSLVLTKKGVRVEPPQEMDGSLCSSVCSSIMSGPAADSYATVDAIH